MIHIKITIKKNIAIYKSYVANLNYKGFHLVNIKKTFSVFLLEKYTQNVHYVFRIHTRVPVELGRLSSSKIEYHVFFYLDFFPWAFASQTLILKVTAESSWDFIVTPFLMLIVCRKPNELTTTQVPECIFEI